MIQLTDREKDLINRNKSYLKNNDIKGFCNQLANYNEDLCGRIMQFLLDNGVPVFDYIEQIPDYMFYNAEFDSISIPDHITRIGKFAFMGCKNLKSVDIGNSVSVIGDAAFAKCTNLKQVFLPNSVKILGKEVFKDCDDTIIYAEERGPGNRLKCKQGEIPWYKEHLFRQPEQETAGAMDSEE